MEFVFSRLPADGDANGADSPSDRQPQSRQDSRRARPPRGTGRGGADLGNIQDRVLKALARNARKAQGLQGDGVLASASVIDSRTNDATTIPAKR